MVTGPGEARAESLSHFETSNLSVEPPPPPDYLAGAVLQGLARPIGYRLTWGVLKSLVLGGVSFGLLPLIAWTRNFRAFATAEQQQLLHLARWTRANSNHPLALQLERDAHDLRPRPLLGRLPLFIAAVTAAIILLLMQQVPFYPEWDQLIAGTYGYHHSHVLGHRVIPLINSREIFRTWVFGLSIAYLAHALQVHVRALDIKRFVARFSEIAQSEGINRVKATPLGTTLRPLWIAGAVVFWLAGAPWGVLAMLAGAAQRRYITFTSRQTRSDLAQRLRTMLVRRRPSAAGLATPVYLRERCVEPLCRAEILRGVNYCPRCGTRQKPHVNRVA